MKTGWLAIAFVLTLLCTSAWGAVAWGSVSDRSSAHLMGHSRLAHGAGVQPLFLSATTRSAKTERSEADFELPDPQPHSLPETLARWHDSEDSGDYFEAIAPSPVGYLVWSRFPIRVYVERFNLEPSSSSTAAATATLLADDSAEAQRHQRWRAAVIQGIHEWATYLALQVIDEPDGADISIWATAPPLQRTENGEIGRARTAETRYEFYIEDLDGGDAALFHRFIVLLSPGLPPAQITATARHEIGHALGLWGHSPSPTDVLYASQVRVPPAISTRDVNTLRRVYEQPTQIGWPLKD